MIINFQFWQHCRLESEVLISDKYFVIFDADFEQLENIDKIFKIFREKYYFPSMPVFYRKFPIQKCFWT